MRGRSFPLILATAALLGGCGAGVPTGVGPGQRPASVQGVTDDGAAARLPADVDGPQTVLFWASWCGACGPLARELAASEPSLVLVNAGEAPSIARATRPAAAHRALLDADGRLRRAFAVDALPLVLLIDEDGVIRHRSATAPAALPERPS